ncbi:MAG: hypothetical protein JRF60_09025 [Deltaproteobacteria bacterium]|nr:hypothetical protein [Deltaproteobacteria bacterium]MBW2562654.1 hypothetical protein [Deltaproteobacteria bacterium]
MKKIILYTLIFFAVIIFCFIGYISLGFYAVSGTHIPVANSRFFFHQTGQAIEYTFKPKVFKYYNVRIISTQPFPIKEKFDWIIKYEIIDNGKLIKEGYLKELTRSYAGKDLSNASAIDFESFGTLKKWPGSITLRLFVEKGDQSSAKYENQFKVNVRISWYI